MMRTLLLVGIAAIAAVSAKPALANHTDNRASHVERRVIIVNGDQVEDSAVYRSSADRAPTERDYRGRWQGEWNGTWETPEGQVYHGTYDGSYDAEADGQRHVTRERHSQDNRRWRDGDERWDDRQRGPHTDVRYSDDDLARMCRRDDGVGGGLIGGVVGGVVGNRVAGRGNRTAGTLIGAGAGAIIGSVVDRAEDRNACNVYWSRSDSRDYRGGRERYDGGRYESGYDSRYGDERYYGRDERYASYGYGGGYDYIPGAPTTIVIPGQPVIIEETETYYETVTVAAPRARAAPRRRAHRASVRPRPTCVCR